MFILITMENYLPKTMDFYLPKSMDFSLPFTPKLQNKNTHYCMSKFPNIANHNLKKYKSIAGIFNL